MCGRCKGGLGLMECSCFGSWRVILDTPFSLFGSWRTICFRVPSWFGRRAGKP